MVPRPVPDTALAPSDAVPCWLAQLPPGPVFAAGSVPPPCGPHPSRSRFTEPSRYNATMSPLDHAAVWDSRSTSSTPPLGYEAAGDESPTPMPIFDWSPDPMPSTADSTAKDPMCSQSFMNMMTQDVETDLKVLTQLPTPGNGGKGAWKRGGNYHHDEDIQLCVSWMNVTNDPIVGNEQPSKTYWNRIADDYHANKTFDSDRTVSSLEHRWGTIQKECMKFQGYYEEVERRHRSGIPYKEHMIEAQARYTRSDPKGRACPFIHCWLKVRHCEKFISLHQSLKEAKRSSKSSTPSEGDEGGHVPTPDSSMPPTKRDRPPGRKQSKEKLKRYEGGDEYKEVWDSFLLMKTEEHKLKEARWNASNMLEERRLQIEERRLLWEQEQKIMFCDVSTMDASQKAYVLAMRAEIASAKVASINSGALGGGSRSNANEHGSGGDGDSVDFSSV